MASSNDVDVIVLGSGAGGLTAALAAAQSGASVALFEKAELLGGEVQRSAATTDLQPGEVHRHVPQLQLRGRRRTAMEPPQERPHPGQQFVAAERFDQVVVRPGVQAPNPVFHAALGCQHQDRQGTPQTPQLVREGEPVETGHHDVEQDQVGLLGQGPVEAFGSLRGSDHPVTFRHEQVGQHRAHGGFIFDDQDAGHRRCGFRFKFADP
jgi:hypothetical protein